MKKVRIILVGGFLGAGKTTTIARLARTFQAQGQNVGVVTNDQAADLVDTHTLREQGFRVGEVAGACFCCSFDDLTSTIESLEEQEQPDVILAEPVGSCTDIVATVIQPLSRLYAERFVVSPYGVILKPSHGKRILGGAKKAGFSPKAAYIFRKQLEEADFLMINRIDELAMEEVDELQQLLQDAVPNTPVIRISANTGAGFEQLVDLLHQQGEYGNRILEIDYDVYAEGEAELGWLNSRLTVMSEAAFRLDDLLMQLVTGLKSHLEVSQSEIAHLKVVGLWEGYHGVANVISSDSEPRLSFASDCETKSARIVINARVATSPEQLQNSTEGVVADVCQAMHIQPHFEQTQAFRPERPVPTHRFDKNGQEV